MAIRVILLLTLFIGLCVTDSKENLALNAVVVQSSLYNTDGDAQHAVDGKRDSNWAQRSCTHTQVEFNPWLRIDLGNVYGISRVALTNRGDCCKERIRGVQIRIGNSLENNGNNNELAATVLTVFDGTKTFEFEPVNGRYVNLVLPGNDEILTLCEVEVFAEDDKPLYLCAPRNLALGGRAAQSSTYPQFGAAENAVDGNRQSIHALGSCSVTNGDRDPWWRVDLGDVYRVTRVSVTNRGDCCEKRIEGIQIRIGNSLDNNGNNNELAANVGVVPLGGTKSFEFKPMKGRYVNLFLPGRNEYLTLCEVEVYSGSLWTEVMANGQEENAALWGKSSQSSNYSTAYPQLALDGLPSTFSHTNEESDPWWRVDLLKVYRVNRVTITNRPTIGFRINGAVIRIGNFLAIGSNNICAVISTLGDGATANFSCGGMEGRYMIVQLTGDKRILSLSEVGVFGDLAGNLAVDGVTTQSSTFTDWFAEKAIDSNRGLHQNTSCSSTLSESNPWWRLDLREPYKIIEVVITNRNDCCSEQLNGAEIHIGNSLENDGNSNPICAVIAAIPAGVSYRYSCDRMEGRYVNLIIPGDMKTLVLCEVEVYGEVPNFRRSLVKMQFNSRVDLTDPSLRENVGSALADRGCTNVTLRWSQMPKRVK
ncbi:uncharacterized protein LOC122349455 [Puntigrus tetrazona]|uniref:uncharacterized protein LOC122349455 n=1 Tax=Puntigrus tetrazona TaxID=1606681 RepID=UPI001C89CC4E|nr:uncharacterized protein LOC122349455 [Puntigrus tetrazona]